jgi:glutathione S-transferase
LEPAWLFHDLINRLKGPKSIRICRIQKTEKGGGDFLKLSPAGHDISLADLAFYAYTQFADESGFDLTTKPNIKSWLRRVKNQLK